MDSYAMRAADKPVEQIVSDQFKNMASWVLALRDDPHTKDPAYYERLATAALKVSATVDRLEVSDRRVRAIRKFPAWTKRATMHLATQVLPMVAVSAAPDEISSRDAEELVAALIYSAISGREDCACGSWARLGLIETELDLGDEE